MTAILSIRLMVRAIRFSNLDGSGPSIDRISAVKRCNILPIGVLSRNRRVVARIDRVRRSCILREALMRPMTQVYCVKKYTTMDASAKSKYMPR